MKQLSDIGLAGLAVMGENLVLNMESKGFTVTVYNRTTEKVDAFLNGRGKNKNIRGAHSIKELVDSLESPRKIMLMVKAGNAVDELIEQLISYLSPGDIIIDGGNSYFLDTIRRTEYLEGKGLLFIGTGVSGGEEGALHGPSIMPGGSTKAWPYIKPIFQAIAAKVDNNIACCEWMGENGAGHFVKMVHNGIEYGDMQLISEAYFIMRNLLRLSNQEMSDIFKEWNSGDLNSYLIEITSNILSYKDENGDYLIDKILDSAGQKGTGKWTGIEALNLGVPVTLIVEAVFARSLSSEKDERVEASKLLKGPELIFNNNKKAFIDQLGKALYAAKIISYAQGFALLKAAANEYKWSLNYGNIALIWRGGCIIRSVFLNKINDAFVKDPQLPNLLLDPFFKEKLSEAQVGLRNVVSSAIQNGIAIPAFSAAISYLDGYRSDFLPANLIQAQRDYFGAHTYERTDKPRGNFFHTNWTGQGGKTSSTSYNV
jgi:6-phosphogluconate dehydrogenase